MQIKWDAEAHAYYIPHAKYSASRNSQTLNLEVSQMHRPIILFVSETEVITRMPRKFQFYLWLLILVKTLFLPLSSDRGKARINPVICSGYRLLSFT